MYVAFVKPYVYSEADFYSEKLNAYGKTTGNAFYCETSCLSVCARASPAALPSGVTVACLSAPFNCLGLLTSAGVGRWSVTGGSVRCFRRVA